MMLNDHALLITVLILVGTLVQQFLLGREQRRGKRLRVWRPLLLTYWGLFGLAMFIGGTNLFVEQFILLGIAAIALGLGLLLTNSGVILNREALRYMGIFVGALAPVMMGIYFMKLEYIVIGSIFLALGIGVFFSNLPGWLATMGKFVMGGLIIAGGLFMLAGLIPTGDVRWLTLIMGVMMMAMGIIPIWGAVTELRRATSPPAATGQR